MKEVYYVVDLGTTTIDTCIIEADSKKELFHGSSKNPQSLYGSDVMNRILTVERDITYLRILSDLVKKLLLDELYNWFAINKLCKLKSAVITGNTTMISILLEKNVSSMSAYPFEPAIKNSVSVSFVDLFKMDCVEFSNLQEYVYDSCKVFLTGCISAFLGGDIIAGVKYIDNHREDDESYLFLDLGTNGEMILYTDGKYFGTSTACGPAFEACTRNQKVFGNSTLDAICLARKLKKIDVYGAFANDSYNTGLDIGGVHLNSDILRQIMLAKAAIVAGYYSMIQKANLALEDIKHVYIAGGFGFHLNIENAVFLGMIPACLKDKVKILGNTSLEGGKEIVFDKSLQNSFDDGFVKRVKVLDLTEEKVFQSMLIEQCKFEPL